MEAGGVLFLGRGHLFSGNTREYNNCLSRRCYFMYMNEVWWIPPPPVLPFFVPEHLLLWISFNDKDATIQKQWDLYHCWIRMSNATFLSNDSHWLEHLLLWTSINEKYATIQKQWNLCPVVCRICIILGLSSHHNKEEYSFN